ncbi:MAG: hypothetical protein WEC59_08115 [Salibacteraceae bacterium]
MSRKKKEKDPRIELIDLYKNYVNKYGEPPHVLKNLLHHSEITFNEFKSHYSSLLELECAIVTWYFKRADNLISADKEAASLSKKDMHLAFLYVLIDQIQDDEVFMDTLLRFKRKDPEFLKQLMKTINAQPLKVMNSEGRISELFEKININPKKTALINHSFSVAYFFLKDRSNDKQDTDAFIEKSTDLLFKLTDTSTLTSLIDLGKFMFSRKSTAFRWERKIKIK